MVTLTLDSVRHELLSEDVPSETISAFFENFKSNPKVWRMFERYTLDAISSKKKLGAKCIMERVRWETEIERHEEFKVSNNWTAYYARVFAIKHPAHRSYFDFKRVRGVTV